MSRMSQRKSDEWSYFCQSCQTQSFQFNFVNWSSGNADIDEIIQSSQLNAKKPTEVMEWVFFSEFNDVKEIVRGGLCSIYQAKWSHSSSFLGFNTDVIALKCCKTLPDLLNEVRHCFCVAPLTTELRSS